jgi:uncharacterized protein (DUF2147 family)
MRFIKFLLLIIFFSIKTVLFAQNHPDDIVGYYLNTEPFTGAVSQVYIYNAGNGVYEGMLIWVDVEEGKDQEGLVFLKEMVFNAKDNEWQNGSIIYPGKSGKFKVFMRLEKDGRLRVRGYWGISVLGKTVYWTREQKSRNPKTKHP